MKKFLLAALFDLLFGIAALFLLFVVFISLNPSQPMIVFWCSLIYLLAGFGAGFRRGSPLWLKVILIDLLLFLYIPLIGEPYTMVNISFPFAALVFTVGGIVVARLWGKFSLPGQASAIVLPTVLLALLPTTIMPTWIDFWKTYANGPAPEFVFQTMDGTPVDSGELEGKVVLLDYWDTRCGPCVRLMPETEQFVARYADDPRVVILVVNAGWEPMENARRFVEEHPYNLPFAYDNDSRYSKRMRVNELPTTIIIDQRYEYQWKHVGYDQDKDADFFRVMQQKIDALLEAAG